VAASRIFSKDAVLELAAAYAVIQLVVDHAGGGMAAARPCI
jgi:hypothetical protein